MFVRTKRVKGHTYAYLVKNIWTKKGSRQKNVGYIGIVHAPDKLTSKPLSDFTQMGVRNFFAKAMLPDILTTFLVKELDNHGFIEEKGIWRSEHIIVNPRYGRVRYKGRRCALAVNEGFMCDKTIRRVLFEFRTRNTVPRELAEVMLEAGIGIEKHEFVMLFKRLTK